MCRLGREAYGVPCYSPLFLLGMMLLVPLEFFLYRCCQLKNMPLPVFTHVGVQLVAVSIECDLEEWRLYQLLWFLIFLFVVCHVNLSVIG